jgi:hypothetical protein
MAREVATAKTRRVRAIRGDAVDRCRSAGLLTYVYFSLAPTT